MTLNEQEQRDLRLNVRLTHVPDSITLIDAEPKTLNVNMSVSGSQVLRLAFSPSPTVNIDFRAYRDRNRLYVNSSELRSLVRQATGTQQVGMVYPDSIVLRFTSDPGVKVAVNVEADVTAGPRSLITTRPRVSPDSVMLYCLRGVRPVRSVRTEELSITGLDGSVTRRLRLIAPANTRLVPDSVDVTVEAEPLIFKTRKVVIEPENVPSNVRLITFPAQMTVMYMVPMSQYTHVDPHFRVIADYRTLSQGSDKIKLKLVDVAGNLRNVHLESDSAEYIIERL